MIQTKSSTVLAVIPARGGSKTLPRKNILQFGGRALIAWTIEAALKASCISEVILSSDDEEICAVARSYGCNVPFLRPPALATDTSTSIEVLIHALEQIGGFDYVVLLQPTSPLRTAKDIDSAFDLMRKSNAPACVSVCPVEESPYWMYQLDDNCQLRSVVKMPENSTRRQDLPDVYSLNGAIYIAETDWLLKHQGFLSNETVGFIMPRNRSFDIDTLDDFEAAEAMYSIIRSHDS